MPDRQISTANGIAMSSLKQVDPQSVSGAFKNMRGERLRIFLTCFGAWALANMDQSLFGYAVPSILSEFHTSLETIGLMLSIGFVVAVPGSIIAGLLADRFGRRIMLVACLAASGFVVGLQSLVGTIVLLGVVRAIAFGCSAGLSPITNSLVAEGVPARIRGLMIGLLQCGFPLGWFVASIIAVPLMTNYGWRATFAVGFAVIPLSILIYLLIPESQSFLAMRKARQSNNVRANLRELFATKRARCTLLCGLAFFANGGAYAGSAFYLPIFLHTVRGYDQATAAHIVGSSYAIGILGYIAVSLIGEFLLTRRTTIIVWCWTGALAFLGLIWLPKTMAQDVFWCGLTAVFFYGTAAILATYLLEVFPTRLRATGAATGSAFLNLGFAVYPMIVAHVVQATSWQIAFSALIVPSLFVCGLAVMGLENIPSGRDIDDL